MWVPSKVSIVFGRKEFVTLIEDHARLCWVYLMSGKYEVEKLFKDFYKMIKNQFQTKIIILHYDNGTEYFNEYMENFLKEKVIQHQSTCRDTSQQNRIIDRKNKYSLEVACAIMFSRNILKYL